MSNTYHVISHTHWDREWYEPFEKFRLRLVRLIDHLLELVEKEPEFVFHLDAQTIVLEDYLEIKPKNRRRLKRAIKRGNILIGPWYVQNDLFLTGGEATVRNLLIGGKMVKEFGGSDRMVVYTPDHFGLVSQLPQLGRGFGLDSVIFGRGRICTPESGAKAEFIWQGPDGSRLLAIQMANFYNNAQRFSADPERAAGFFELARKKLEPVTSTSQYLLMNGVDHLEAQENLLEILPALQRRLPARDRIIQSTLFDFCQGVRRELVSPSVEPGEKRVGNDRWILQGTLSSRVYLKIANIRTENFLARRLEVLNSMLRMLPFGRDAYDREVLAYLWKTLIHNHPHDSICGCSRDAVHRHMEDRFARIAEAGELLLEEKMRLLGSHLNPGGSRPDDYYVLAVNTLPFGRTALVETDVDLKSDEKIETFGLFDDAGRPVPFRMVSSEKNERRLRSPINLPGRMPVDRHRIRFIAELPATGYRVYMVRRAEKVAEAPALRFENRFLKVEIGRDGRIDLVDKRRGRRFEDVFALEDAADFGDSYSHRPGPEGGLFSTRGLMPDRVEFVDHAVESVAHLDYTLRLPREADPASRTRSSELVEVPVALTFKLRRDCPYLEIDFKLENRVNDHCLRAVVRTGIDSGRTLASSMFDAVERDKHAVRPQPADDEHEPAFEFVKIRNPKQGGMAVLVEGLHGYQNYRDRTGELGITLVRGTRYITGYFEKPLDDDWIAPENQCLRTIEGRLALLPGDGSDSVADEASAAIDFLNPPLSRSDSCDPLKFSGGRPCVQESDLSEIFFRPDPYAAVALPPSLSLCEINDPAMVMTALKAAERGPAMVLRFYSLAAEPRQVAVRFPAVAVKYVEKCRLDETMPERLRVRDHAVTVSAGPREIVTLKLYF